MRIILGKVENSRVDISGVDISAVDISRDLNQVLKSLKLLICCF